VNGHAPEKGYFLATVNRVNGYAPEKGTVERVCSGIWNVLFQFVVFSSCLIPVFRANEHEKRGFEWSTFSLKLKSIYSKVGGYAPEYVMSNMKLLKSKNLNNHMTGL
jgi:hypothetical protein